MRTCPHLVDLRQGGNFFHVRDATRMNNGGADVINQLLLYELLAIEDGIEDLAHGQRGYRVLADEPEALLQFSRGWVFQPEQMIWFQLFSQPRCFYGGEPVVRIMQQVDV